MDKRDIQIFLAIVEEKSIQKAADMLYMSPTTVGSRLRALEKELGATLVERQKGIKTATITTQGIHFLSLAHKLLALMDASEHLDQEESNLPLSVATADSFLQYNLVPLYRKITADSSLFSLDIQLYPSDMIYPRISNHQADIGFSLYQINYTDVIARPLFADDVVVVVPASSPLEGPTVHPRQLRRKKEYFIGSKTNLNVGWGQEFNAWHQKWINAACEPKLRVNSCSILSYFLDDTDYWTLLPRSLALGQMKYHDLRILELEEPAPRRICYQLTNRVMNESMKKEVALFCRLLEQYLPSIPGIELIKKEQ